MNARRPMVHFNAYQILNFAKDALCRTGVRSEDASITAEGLWTASLRGVESHGLRLLPHYIAAVKGGRINRAPQLHFEQSAPAGGHLDADHGFGHVASVHAMGHAIEMAKQTGAGFVSVRHSSHCGALANAVLRACPHDMIGIGFTNATAKVRSPGSIRPFLGINPMCVAAPMSDEEPFCYDAAPTQFSNNKVKQFAEVGRPLPAGVAADENGRETTVAALAQMLLPIGIYKGFGLAAVAEVFCGLLSGMPAGPDVTAMYGNSLSERRNLAHFFGAIRIDVFETPRTFKQRLTDLANRLRAEPRDHESELFPQFPGDPEKRNQAQRITHGIPFSEADVVGYKRMAIDLQLALPDPIATVSTSDTTQCGFSP